MFRIQPLMDEVAPARPAPPEKERWQLMRRMSGDKSKNWHDPNSYGGIASLFLHFVVVATTNAPSLHCEINSTKQGSMSHKNFLSELVSQLCGVDRQSLT
ncbi:piggyBac transposable element-derived protein 4-like protein [Lates japonicus]|uniref:PiggyBac transposable element-derived protein 4-like protein n=1 Tax=Lates japonicus TaxID=270547 RepID=A0AAD3MTS1_LATJO|nr:piggyBac transposable element-derived protein 4-like protein [Lates japonicus]